MTTVTLVCGDEPSLGVDSSNWLLVHDLCTRPGQMIDLVGDAERAVVVLHRNTYDLAQIQKALRATDIDPLGAQIVTAGADGSVGRPTLAGLAARAAAFDGSRPENVKPIFPGAVTRRGFLRPPAPVYIPAPRVDHAVCAAEDGCRACADACPRDAYTWRNGRIHFDKDVCEPCGRCVTACPVEAIENPASTPTMLGSQIDAIVGSKHEPVGIRFVCRDTAMAAEHGWVDVELPCTGMIRGAWLLTVLLLGADAVAAIPCSAGGCPLGLDQHTREAIDFAQKALAAAGLDEAMVAAESGHIGEGLERSTVDAPFTWHGDLEALTALMERTRKNGSLTHRGSSTAQVTIDPASCTLCAQCARTCPTQAIEAAYDGHVVSLSFDAARCTNCSQCVMACPETERGAIQVEGKFDRELVSAGRTELHIGEVLVCESCGDPIAPSPMMDRIGELLGGEFSATMDYLSRRCLDCRGAG